MYFCVCLFVILNACFATSLVATVYFVDSHNGSDLASGMSEDRAWKSHIFAVLSIHRPNY